MPKQGTLPQKVLEVFYLKIQGQVLPKEKEINQLKAQKLFKNQ